MSDITLPMEANAVPAPGRPGFVIGEFVGLDYEYRIIDRLGCGRESEVYAAVDLGESSLGVVALRAYRELTPEDSSRIDTELAIHGSLSDQAGILAMHGSGVAEVGGQQRRYAVLELAARGTLSDAIKRKPYDSDRALKVATSLALGMEAMDRRGVVHRDIKPSNIFAGHEADTWKIGDFGLATRIGETSLGQDTIAGLIPGTFGYVPAEGLDDESPITPRFDTFSFGVTVFMTATGELPFRLDPRKPEDYRKVITGQSPTSMRALNRNTSTGLDNLIRHCLSPQPVDRPSSEDLTRALATI